MLLSATVGLRRLKGGAKIIPSCKVSYSFGHPTEIQREYMLIAMSKVMFNFLESREFRNLSLSENVNVETYCPEIRRASMMFYGISLKSTASFPRYLPIS